MKIRGGTIGKGFGLAAVALAGFLIAAAPSNFVSIPASAQEATSDSAIRLYFALPFGGSAEKKEPGRLGFQLLSEQGDDMLYTPLPTEPEKFTAIDLGFNRNGLAKFDVFGEDVREDVRNAYERFARAIGLTPDEVELCRETDCLDWVKSGEDSVITSRSLAAD